MKMINSLISMIVLIVMLVSPQKEVSAAEVLVWESKQDMPTPRYSMGAAVSAGKIYTVGGDNYSCTPLNNVEEYDPDTNTWNIRKSMPTRRWALGAATGPDGKIYAIGGAGGNCGADILGTVEMYDPVTDTWESRANMPTPRMELRAVAAANGKIYAMGGKDNSNWFATVEEYDPATDTWTTKSNMPWANKLFAITASSDGKIYVLGGDAAPQAFLVYDPAIDSWESRASMPTARYNLAMSQASNGRMYAVGGDWGGTTSTVESYNPEFDSWSAETSISTPRNGHSVITVGDTIYAIGGWGGLGPIASVEAGTVVSVPSPANDNFVDAMVIQSLPFSDVQDTTGATTEYDEPQNCVYSSRTVWYSFTPTANVSVLASMTGSNFNTNISIYQKTGDGLVGLRFSGCATGGFDFIAHKGVTYYLQVGANDIGDLHLDIQEGSPLPPPPANDDFDNAVLLSSLPFTDVVDVTFASRELGEPQSCDFSPQTVWYEFTPTANAEVSINTEGSSFSDTVLSVYEQTGSGFSGLSHLNCVSWGGSLSFSAQEGVTYYIQAGSVYGSGGSLQLNLQEIQRPINDDFANAISIKALPYSNTQDTSSATSSPDDPTTCTNNGSVWYRFTATSDSLIDADTFGSNYDTVLSVYTGEQGSLVQVTGGCNDDYNGLQSHVAFPATPGTTYYFLIGRCCGSGGSGGGYLQFNVKEIARPANDDFTKAKDITVDALPFNDSVDIGNATIEPGEPQGCYYSPKTVWYSFTPTENMLVQVDMFGSTFWDTVLNIYEATGPSISDLTFLKCANFGETAKFTAQAGVTYYLQAGSYYGSSGILQLNLQELPRPVNDDFVNAALIPGPLPFDGTVNTQNATREGNEPRSACSYSSDPGTVWYAYTPTTSGSVSASIPRSSYMPVVVAVYTGNSLSSLTEAGCMTTYGGDRLTFRANTNTTYYLQLSNYHTWEQGEINLYLETAPLPVAVFDYAPFDPSTFDTIHFSDISYDPGYVNFESFTWDFGDGTISTEENPDHKYAKDGDYTVQHSVITFDGRTASTSQVVHVKTRDVAIAKLSAPQSASAGQTRTITVSLSSKTYSETVRVDLYRSGAGGFEFIGTQTLTVPAYNANRTVAYNFSYTFTSSDASIGKVTFYAVATIVDGRDIFPADNEAYSLPTKVNKRR